MILTIVWLIVIQFSGYGSITTIYEMLDYKTCKKVLDDARIEFPSSTTENENGVLMYCVPLPKGIKP